MKDINLGSITEQAFREAEILINRQGCFSQPFRNRFDHTKRVLKWAKRIHEIEGGDIEIITLAVIFHDTGWSEKVDHAQIGAEQAEKYLLGQFRNRDFETRGSCVLFVFKENNEFDIQDC